MAETKYEIQSTPRVSEQIDMSRSAIRLPAARRRLLMVAALACVLAVAAAYLTTRGWSDAARELSHAFGHLPKPLQTLFGGSRFAHLLLAAAQ